MNKTKFLVPLLALFFPLMVLSQNPIIGDIGISDPHVRVFNDTIFLYSGHDSSPEDKTWVMKDWRIFSTTDLINWEFRGKISPQDNYMDDNSTDCWAGDAATRNGKYYFYFSDRKRGVGVMTSDLPSGPFTDALGKPLISPMHDPTILFDNDREKTPYLFYGDKEGGGYHVAKLNNNMISLAEKPKPIIINGKEWENAPAWMDKNYIFKHNDTYYLSWGPFYATSKNVYGPYKTNGSVGSGFNLNTFAHSSFFWWKGQFYHIWCYYINPMFKYRATIISYCHIDMNGNLVTDTNFLEQHFESGVGQYNANWPKIEAEWYYEILGDIQKQGNEKGEFALSNLKNGDWIRFANVTFEKEFKTFFANVSLKGKGGAFEIRTDSPDGKILGKLQINAQNTSHSFQEISCKLQPVSGNKDLFLVFKGNETNEWKLDWFKFEE